jgi:hypothetical protein
MYGKTGGCEDIEVRRPAFMCGRSWTCDGQEPDKTALKKGLVLLYKKAESIDPQGKIGSAFYYELERNNPCRLITMPTTPASDTGTAALKSCFP